MVTHALNSCGSLQLFQITQRPSAFQPAIFGAVETEQEKENVAADMEEVDEEKKEQSGLERLLEGVESVEDLVALGGEQLKRELAAVGLKCGGTVRQRAERLLLVKTVGLSDMPMRHRVKKATHQ